MNITELIKITERPVAYTIGSAVMWQDPYIAERLLETHLSQAVDLASRKESTIDLTLDWILEKVMGAGLNILDLGCGPGLYTERLAEMGHNVTGIDFSENSIRYARKSAEGKGLDVKYLEQNYLELEATGDFDLVMMIFTDFGVLLPEERRLLTKKVLRVLKPGGLFIFDVLNKKYSRSTTGTKSWEVKEQGFWRENPSITLTETFYYEAEKVSLSQHAVIDEQGEMAVYRFWVHSFSHEELDEAFLKAGFSGITCFENVIPDSDICPADHVTFCVAEK